jgi:hypothetical protein
MGGFNIDPISAGGALLGGLIKHGSGGNRLAHVSADALQGEIEQKKASQNALWQFLGQYLRPYGYDFTATPPTAEQLKANKFAAPMLNFTDTGNWNPLNTPDFKNMQAQLAQKQSDIYQKNLPGMTAGNLKGNYGAAYNADVLKRGLAKQEATANRDYYTQQQANRQAVMQTILNVLQGNAQGVGNDATSLAGIGQGMQQQEDAAYAQKQETLAQIIALARRAAQGKANSPYSPTLPAGPPYNPNDPYAWVNGSPVSDPLDPRNLVKAPWE